MKQKIGVAGLAVMGENLVLNMASKGFSVAVYNRTYEKTERFLGSRAAGKDIAGFREVKDFVEALESPRKVMMMLKAGSPVDQFIDQLLPHLDEGDIIIDGGNSNYHDTLRRQEYLESKGLRFIGTGVSGGEEGALKGPSIMPGGSPEAWPFVEPVFMAAAARVDDGSSCCAWMGPGGAGHFVKMVHNGIEYGDMQLICEAYHFMKSILGMSVDEIHSVFSTWNEGELSSYLIEITAEITYVSPLPAPVAAGDVVGELVIHQGVRDVSQSVPLVATEDVERGGLLVRVRTATSVLMEQTFGREAAAPEAEAATDG